SSAWTSSRLGMPDAFDDVTLDRARQPVRRERRFTIDAPQMVEALVADAREALRLTCEHAWREPGRFQLRVRGLEAEELEDAEDEATVAFEMCRGSVDHAIEERPSVGAPVVGRGLGVVPVAPGRRRHLRRIRADEIEALVAAGIPAVAEARVDGDAVERGGDADRVDRARHAVAGRDARPRPRPRDRRR